MEARPNQLESMLSQWQSDDSLLDSGHFARRMAIQDELDRLFTHDAFHRDASPNPGSPDLGNRARALYLRLESINNELFTSIRGRIQAGNCPAEFAVILHNLATPPRGLVYDYLDDLVAGVLQFNPPSGEPRPLGPDSVFYQPTPARHIFHLIGAAAISESDTLIDLGSGLGHVPLLATICTGATSIGIELDPDWVASATECAHNLNLQSVTFRPQNARSADLSSASVFYLYTPFTGDTLAAVLESIRNQSTRRPIRVCTFGPCTAIVGNEPWLKPITPLVSDQVSVFVPLG